jgi:hypothetical protein
MKREEGRKKGDLDGEVDEGREVCRAEGQRPQVVHVPAIVPFG